MKLSDPLDICEGISSGKVVDECAFILGVRVASAALISKAAMFEGVSKMLVIGQNSSFKHLQMWMFN